MCKKMKRQTCHVYLVKNFDSAVLFSKFFANYFRILLLSGTQAVMSCLVIMKHQRSSSILDISWWDGFLLH